MKKIVILISGRGSNMQALLTAKLPCQIAAVISNVAEAAGLDIAKKLNIPTHLVAHRDYTDRSSFELALSKKIDDYRPDFIILAGFMRILTEQFVNNYRGKLINIHPSLLPAYAGMNTHERALKDGVKIHGCTVHFVTPDLDHGPIIVQAAVPVLGHDTVQTLSQRVLGEEHVIFPEAVRWLCSGQTSLDENGKVKHSAEKHIGVALISPVLE